MRIVVDYRPALRERTGAGEYIRHIIHAYTARPDASNDQLVLFSSSWKDRAPANLGADMRADVVDRSVPVKALNYLWHRLEWPPIESLAGDADVVHAAHPLLIPSKRAAQVVTIHDLYFMTHPERTTAEIRRDYPVLAPDHAARADAVVVPSHYTEHLITERFHVPAERVHVCSPGPPVWTTLGHGVNIPRDGYVLFVGTLEPRKNLGALLDAYAVLLAQRHTVPELVIAGRPAPGSEAWLERISRPPLANHVRRLGYVPISEREKLFAKARLLVLPSEDEGFGLPVLEAMSAGIPVVAANRGSLPEVLGDAGILVDPNDSSALANAMARMFDDEAFASACAWKGLERARSFSWDRAAASLRAAYQQALAHRRARGND